MSMKLNIGGSLALLGGLAAGGLIALAAPRLAQGQSGTWSCYNLSLSDPARAASSASAYTQKMNTFAPNATSGTVIQISPYSILGGGAVEGTSARLEVANFVCVAQ